MVTVVITTHKRDEDILKRAIDSVLNQTYKDIELIIVDDSPSDYSRRDAVEKMVEGYDDIQYIKHEVNKGACAARNTGLRFSNGEYIAYLDDDDEWMPEKIELQLAGFKNENTALVYCGRLSVDERNNKVYSSKSPAYTGSVYRELLIGNFIGSTSYPLIRTQYLKEINGFDVEMKSAQDADVWLRLAEKYNVEYIDKPLVLYHIHEGERISTNYEDVCAGLERIIEKNKSYLINHKDILSIRYLKLARAYVQARHYKKGRDTWIKAVRCYPLNIPYHVWYLFSMIKVYIRGR